MATKKQWGRPRKQKVEEHLADCPRCRRVLEFHRTRFAFGSTPTLMTDSPNSTVHRPDCPTAEDLRNLAAGLAPPGQASQLIQHAARCAHCGIILNIYTVEFSGDLTWDEQVLLAKLESGTREWQQRLLAKLGIRRKSGFQ